MRPWTTDTYLLAGAVNMLYAANRQRANQKTKKPLIEPPRAQKPKRKVTVAQLAAKGIGQRLKQQAASAGR